MGTLLKLSTKIKRMPGSAGAGAELVRFKRRNDTNTAWIDCPFVKRRNADNTAWIWELSTPNGTLSGGGASTPAAASTSGTAAVGMTATPGGVHSGNLSYGWAHSPGSPANYGYANTNTATPTASYNFTGVGPEQTASLPAEQVYCVITDNETGAQWQTDPITVGPFSFHNTTPAYNQISLSGPSDVYDECHVGLAPGNCLASATATLSLSGGPSSPTYSWAYLSGDSSYSVSGGTNTLSLTLQKSWHVNNAGSGPGSTATWRCTAHDGIGSDVTHDVTFHLDSFGDND